MKRALLGLVSATVLVLTLACQSAAPTPGTAPAASSAPAPAPKAAEKPAEKAAEKPAEKAAAKEPPKAAPKEAAANAVQELYEAAKKEGEVIWQTPGIADEDMDALLTAFQKKYPGIKVSNAKSSTQEIIRRVVAEAPSGRFTLDVGLGGVDEMRPLLERDLLPPNDWSKLSDTPAINVLLDGKFVAIYDLANAWIYNSRTVGAADVPKTWEDLLSPKWKGRKIGVLDTGSLGFEAIAILGKWDRQKYTQFLRDLKAQELIVETRGAGLAERIADGQIPLGSTTITLIPAMVARGAPLDLAPLGPLTFRRFGVYTVKGVPHPNAAKLLIAWLSSNEVRPLWNKGGRGAASPCDASPVAKMLCDKKIEVMLDDGLKSEQIFEYQKLNRETLGLIPQ